MKFKVGDKVQWVPNPGVFGVIASAHRENSCEMYRVVWDDEELSPTTHEAVSLELMGEYLRNADNDISQIAAFAKQSEAQWRKERPVATGVLAYFPDALMEVAYVSKLGNDQHNPGEPLHWARGKSMDQMDAALRHIIDYLSGNHVDTDGAKHLAKAVWRLAAQLQLDCEAEDET